MDETAKGYFDQIRDEKNSSAQICDVFSKWASNYDDQLDTIRTSKRLEYITGAFDRLLKSDKNARVLDLAAGTGHFGAKIAEQGYKNIDAVDGSEGMLEQARKRNIYGRIVCSLVGADRMDFQDNYYDLIFCAGALYDNHVSDACFPELLRITKPGGYMVFTVTEKDASKKIEKTMQEYHDQKKWKWLERTVIEGYSIHVFRAEDGLSESLTGLIYVFQKPE